MIVFLMLSFLCIFGEKIEKILHDKYIFLEPIPFPGMNYRLCYWVVVVSCFAYFNRHIQKKKIVHKISVLIPIILFLLITSRKYMYYSNEISMLNQNYFEIIGIDRISTVLDSKEDIVLYIGRTDCPFCQEVLPNIRKHAYYQEEKIYYYNTSADRNYNSAYLNNILEQLQVREVPVILYISEGQVEKRIFYHEIKQNYKNVCKEP